MGIIEPDGILKGSATRERNVNAIKPAKKIVFSVSEIPEFFLLDAKFDTL